MYPCKKKTSLSLWMPRRHLKINIAIFYSKPFSWYLIFCLLCLLHHILFINFNHVMFVHTTMFSHTYHLIIVLPGNSLSIFFQSCYDNILKPLLTILTYCLKFFSINIWMHQVSLSFVTVSYVSISRYQCLIGISAQPPCS